MKKLVNIALACILLTACKKHTFDEALPKITLQSVAPYGGNDTVLLLTAAVTSKGTSAIEYTGFSFSTNPKVDITENQVLFQQSSVGTYTAVVTINKYNLYYFKAFAANNLGYTPSNTLTYMYSGPPQYAPCSLSNNTITDNSNTFTVTTSVNTSPAYGYGGYALTLTGGGESVMMCFSSKPHNGVYTTTTNNYSISNNQVYITINNSSMLYNIYDGESLFVAVNSNGTTTISACTLTYDMGYNPSLGTSTTGTIYGEVTY